MKYIIFFLLYVAMTMQMVAQTAPTDTIASQSLEEVVVWGEKPQVKGQNGIMIVDLPDIVKDKAVTNILEALAYLPGVINNNGLIGLAGASEVTIILNGELTNMSLQNMYQLLYTTPIDRLKNVEIMYAAPAKYHVSGAVINVVLKAPTPLDGLQGQVRAGYHQAHYASYGGTVSATYATKECTFDFNYSVSHSRNWNNEHTFSNHLYKGSRTMIEDDMHRISNNWSNIIYAAISYRRLKLIYNGQIKSDVKARSLSSGPLGNFLNKYSYDGPIDYHNIAMRYSAPFGFSAGGDYTHYGESRTQTLSQDKVYLLGGMNSQDINRLHFYIDQQHDFRNWQLNYGTEYNRTADFSSQVNYPDGNGFSSKNYENVVDAYIGLQCSFDWGLSFNVSAKGEYFHNEYQHNWNFIPQLGATFSKTPQSIFQLDLYTRRIYPSYWELHNITSYINPYSKVIGNPALQPYLNYSGQLSYIFRQKYVATLYVQYGDKATVQLPYQSPEELNLIYQTINMDYKRIVGLNLNIPFNVGHVWNATATTNIFSQREKATHFHNIEFDNHKWVFYGELQNTFKYSENCPLALSVDFAYISPSLQGIADLSSLWKVDVGVKWYLGSKRNCEFDLSATDIFNKWSPTMTINRSGQDYIMKVRDMSRNIKVTFIWRFNGFTPKDTGTDTSRFGIGD